MAQSVACSSQGVDFAHLVQAEHSSESRNSGLVGARFNVQALGNKHTGLHCTEFAALVDDDIGIRISAWRRRICAAARTGVGRKQGENPLQNSGLVARNAPNVAIKLFCRDKGVHQRGHARGTAGRGRLRQTDDSGPADSYIHTYIHT